MPVSPRELHRFTATCIIYKDNKYLIAKRGMNEKIYPGKWAVPGGGLSMDDYVNTPPTHGSAWYNVIDKGLRREIREEVGLEVGELTYLLDLAFVLPNNVPVVTLSFYAPFKSGEIVLDNEDAVEYAWVTAKEAESYDFIEGIKEEIKMVDNILKNRK